MSSNHASYPVLQPRPYPRLLSLVIPIFNEESALPHLRMALEDFMAQVRGKTELILVNDGSQDGTLALLAAWASDDARVKVVNLSRNFGHQSASTAGLD